MQGKSYTGGWGTNIHAVGIYLKVLAMLFELLTH